MPCVPGLTERSVPRSVAATVGLGHQRWTIAGAIVAAIMLCGWFDRGLMHAEQPAEKLISGVDPQAFSQRIKAGDDFYEYVNQGWLDATEIPSDRADYGTFGILDDATQAEVRRLIEQAAATDAPLGSDSQKVGDYYRSYTNLEQRNARGLAPLAPLFESVDQIDGPESLGRVMAELLRGGVAGPFVMFVSPDARKSDQYALQLFQTGITLPDREYYIREDETFLKAREALREYMVDLLREMNVADPQTTAQQLLELETSIAKIQWSRVENRDPVATYNKRTTAEMKELLAAFGWDAFLEAAGAKGHPEFIVKQPSFFAGLNRLLAEIPLETWKSYLKFRILNSYAPMATAALDDRHFALHGTAIKGVEQQEPLWKRAVQSTGGTLGELVGKLYVEEKFTPEAKRRMEGLVENLKRAFALRIDGLDWMGAGTKRQAKEKLERFTTKIGYPDEWKNYDPLVIDAADLLGNAIRSAAFEYQDSLDKLGGPIDRGEWQMTPQTINAYYSPVMNEIVFPAAILQPPFFNLEADDAVNYGAIGAVIGHELSHGFDDKGSKYDGNGNLRDWWTPEDRAEFESRAGRLVQQYSQYKPFEGMAVNGELTLGENIGDLGGLAVALEAYKLSLEGKAPPVIDGLTGMQRFFLGWSQIWRRKYRDPELRRRLLNDPHSPSRYRVNGIVSNMDAFYEAFDVKPEDPMYIAPENRVRIW